MNMYKIATKSGCVNKQVLHAQCVLFQSSGYVGVPGLIGNLGTKKARF